MARTVPELNLGWAFSERELDGRARNRSQAACLIEAKPRDIRYASGICERHGLICNVGDITMGSNAHWMRTAGRKWRTGDRLECAGRSNFEDRNRVAARVYRKKMLAMNAKRSLRIQIAAGRHYEALSASCNGRSRHFAKRAVGQT